MTSIDQQQHFENFYGGLQRIISPLFFNRCLYSIPCVGLASQDNEHFFNVLEKEAKPFCEYFLLLWHLNV